MHKKLPNIYVFLDHYNNQIFENSITNIGVIYRNYKEKNREKELIKIAKACKKNRCQLFISNDVKLALKFKADGVYVPSFNKTDNFSNFSKKNITILGSAHNQREIHKKVLQNCKGIFLSPVFYVKKSRNFLGLHRFNFLTQSNKINLFALGGIKEHNIKKLKLLNAKGFGGISLFKKKPAYKRPVF